MLNGNLSTRPFYNDRAVTVAVVVVAVLAVLMTSYNAMTLVSLSGRRGAIRARIEGNRSQAETLRSEAGRVQQGIDRASLTQLALSADEANRLIDDRTFSWTGLFRLLEGAMPMDVRLVSVSPRTEKGKRLVSLSIVARDLTDIDGFIDALLATGAFHDVAPTEKQYRDDGTYAAQVEGVYRTSPPAASVAAAAPAGGKS